MRRTPGQRGGEPKEAPLAMRRNQPARGARRARSPRHQKTGTETGGTGVARAGRPARVHPGRRQGRRIRARRSHVGAEAADGRRRRRLSGPGRASWLAKNQTGRPLGAVVVASATRASSTVSAPGGSPLAPGRSRVVARGWRGLPTPSRRRSVGVWPWGIVPRANASSCSHIPHRTRPMGPVGTSSRQAGGRLKARRLAASGRKRAITD